MIDLLKKNKKISTQTLPSCCSIKLSLADKLDEGPSGCVPFAENRGMLYAAALMVKLLHVVHTTLSTERTPRASGYITPPQTLSN